MKQTRYTKMILAAMFLAIGMVLPFLTGQIKTMGETFLPMHLPVMLCGLICGWKYGLAVGLILPILRSACFGMPPLYPVAIWMTAELATYGFVIGFLYRKLPQKGIGRVLTSLLAAMLLGRVAWGVVKALLLAYSGNRLLFSMFIAEGFINAFPGILLQLILIPAIMHMVEKRTKQLYKEEKIE